MGEKSIHDHHRERMYERVRKNGFEGFSDHEVLEYMLYFALPRIDTNPLAHALIDHFGGYAQVLEASEEELRAVPGIGPASARLIHSILMFSRHYQISKTRSFKQLDSCEKLVEYCVPLFHGITNERIYIIMMDDRLKLLGTVLLGEGAANSVDVPSRKLVDIALRYGATNVVLAHNHPGGFALPSQADIRTTQNLKFALKTMGIDLVDHIIVAQDEGTSMLSSSRMPDMPSISMSANFLG